RPPGSRSWCHRRSLLRGTQRPSPRPVLRRRAPPPARPEAARPLRRTPRAPRRCRSPRPGAASRGDDRPAMSGQLTRAWEFMRQGDMFGTRVQRTPYGIAVRTPEIPLRQDSNYLLAETTTATAEQLAGEVERLGLRAVLVRVERVADRLEPEFLTGGWKVHPGGVMARRRGHDREANLSLVTAGDGHGLAPPRRAHTVSQPWGSAALADQQLMGKQQLTQRVEAHFLAVLVEGEVAAYADLYIGDAIAQIEDVLTVEEHRNRGYASALVLYGVREA